MTLSRISLLILVGLVTISCSDQKSVKKGQEFATSEKATIKDCTNKGFEMLIECGVVECILSPADFTKGCAMVAKIDEQYCREMPFESALETVDWVKNQCKDHKDPKSCGNILKHGATRCLSINDALKVSDTTGTSKSPSQK